MNKFVETQSIKDVYDKVNHKWIYRTIYLYRNGKKLFENSFNHAGVPLKCFGTFSPCKKFRF